MGAEPPEGFDIKGNERSMKYHLQGSGGYERTITDAKATTPVSRLRGRRVRAGLLMIAGRACPDPL